MALFRGETPATARRPLLVALAAVSLAAVAGCGGSLDATTTPSAGTASSSSGLAAISAVATTTASVWTYDGPTPRVERSAPPGTRFDIRCGQSGALTSSSRPTLGSSVWLYTLQGRAVAAAEVAVPGNSVPGCAGPALDTSLVAMPAPATVAPQRSTSRSRPDSGSSRSEKRGSTGGDSARNRPDAGNAGSSGAQDAGNSGNSGGGRGICDLTVAGHEDDPKPDFC